MKICWDNLEKLRFTKDGNFKIGSASYYEYDNCLECNEPYLGQKNTQYCTYSCSRLGKNNPNYNKNYMDERVVNEHHHMYGKHHSDCTKQKISKTLQGRFVGENNPNYGKGLKKSNNPNWKGGYAAKNIPLYDTYAQQLEPIEQCRRSGNDPNTLEVKCTYCGKWYVPNIIETRNRIYGINEKDYNRFYCSSNCKQECPIFNKSKYYKGQEGYNSREVQPELRQMVFERDDHICIKCGFTEHLHCHHIDPVVNNPIESADIDNCITLCKQCHKEVHQQDGCKYKELRECI